MKNKLLIQNVPRPSLELLMSTVQAKNGLLVPSKPNDGTADFTVARNSKATRVNKNGLIEDASVLGSELIDNNAWTVSGDVTETGGVISFNGGNGYADNVVAIGQGKKCKIEYDINTTTGTEMAVYLRGTLVTATVQPNGHVSVEAVTGTNPIFLIRFQAYGGTFIGEISNVSVKEVIYENVPRIDYLGSTFIPSTFGSELVPDISTWVLGSGATLNGDKIELTSAGSQKIKITIPFVIGTEYQISYDIIDYSSGNARFDVEASSPLGNVNSADGTYVENIIVGQGSIGRLDFNVGISGSFSITNVSVKEITGYTTNDEPSLLLEPQSENIIPYSEDFVTGWTPQNGSLTGNTDVAPDGETTMDTYTEGAAALHRLYPTSGITVASGVSGIFSIFLKAGTRRYVSVAINYGTDEAWATVDTVNWTITGTGSLGTGVYEDSGIEDYGSGIYRIWLKGSLGGQTNYYPLLNPSDVASPTTARQTSSGSETVICWGAEFKVGDTYQTSYIKTEGAPVTRANETCVGGGNVNVINSLRGTWFFEWKGFASDYNNITLSDGTNANRISFYAVTTTGVSKVSWLHATFSTVSIQKNLTQPFAFDKIGMRWSGTTLTLYVNGVKVGDATIVPFDKNELIFMTFDYGNNLGGQQGLGRYKNIKLYKKALQDGQMEKFTT